MKRLLVLMCCLMVVVIATEFSYATGQDPTLGKRPTIPPRLMFEAEQTARPDGRAVSQWETTSLSRPLFRPDRRPDTGLVADSGLPRLTGVIAAPDVARAIFQSAGTGKSVVVGQGETVSGWEVTMISSDVVSLRKTNERIVLRPAFDAPKGGSSATTVVQPVLSRWEAPAATGILRARWSNPQLQP